MNKAVRAFQVLEPRILLDGTLDFSDLNELSGTDQLETLEAMFRQFEEQIDPESGGDSAFVAQLQDAFFDALGDAADMFTLEEGQEATGFGTLDEVFERVRLSLIEVVEEFKDSIDITAYQQRLADAVDDADFAADAGEGTFEDQLRAATFPLVASTPPDYTSAPGGTSWADRLGSATFPDTVDTDGNNADDQSDIDFLNAATRLEITAQGAAGEYTGDIFAFLTDPDANLFYEALGDGTLSAAEIDARLDRVFADIAIRYDPAVGPPSQAFDLDPGTIAEIKATLIAHYDAVNAAYTPDNALSDIDVLDDAAGARINGVDVTGDALAFFTGNPNGLFNTVLGGGQLFDHSYDELIETYLADLVVQKGAEFLTVDPGDASNATEITYSAYTLDPDTREAIAEVMRTQFRAVLGDAVLSPVSPLALVNVKDTAGDDLIAFADAAGGGVDVTVALPFMETLLSEIDRDPGLRAVIPVDFEFTNVASKLSYRLSTTATTSYSDPEARGGAETASQSLTISDLAFVSDNAAGDAGVVFAFGAWDGGMPAALASTAVGFLEGTLIGIDVAQIDLATADTTALGAIRFDSVAEYAFSTGDVTESRTIGAGDIADLDFDLRMKGVGAADFVDYDPASAALFDIARYRFELDLPLSLEDTDTFAFEASLYQQVRRDFAGFAGTDPDLSPPETTPPIFVDGVSDTSFTDVRFEIDNLDAVPEALRPAFGDLADAVWSMDVDIMSFFFEGLGDGLSGALENANFDLGIPLTDFDILDGFDAIADLLASIPDAFRATPEDFGFETAPTLGAYSGSTGILSGNDDLQRFVAVSSEKLVQTGKGLSPAQVEALAALGTVTFSDYAAGDGGYDRTDVDVDFAAVNGLPPASADPADPPPVFDADLYLDNLVDAMNTAFTGAGLTIEAGRTGGALSFTQTGDPLKRLFTLRDTDTWAQLGFDTTDTEARDLTDLTAGATIEGLEVFEFYGGNSDVDLGTLDTLVLAGFDSVRFQVSQGNVQHLIDVQRPALGWGAEGDRLDNFIAAFNDALGAKSIDLEVSKNAAADGLRFNVDTNTDGRFAVAIDVSSLERANSLKGVMSWMQQTVRDLDLMPGFTFEVDLLTGDFLMDFDPIETEQSVEAGLSIDDTRLGDLENVDLQATLAGSLSARLDLAAGFNIFDMQADFASSESVEQAVFDNVFLSDLRFGAVLDAEATEIEAEVEWGMLSFSLGDNDPENFIKLNTELDATLVGQSDAVFADRISASQLDDLGRDNGPGSRLTDLLGRFDLTGGIVIDDQGCPVLIGADTDPTIDRLTIENGEDRGETNEFAMLLLNLDSIALDLGGVGGNLLPEPIRVTVGDLFDPLNTTKLCTDFDACGALVDPGMILDGMIALADMLEAFEGNLATYLPVLDQDLPLLSGNSILSQFSFAGEFREALVELRGDDFGFSDINGFFDDVFGAGNVSINLVTQALNAAGDALEDVCELFFEIDLDYLEDFFVDIPFNLDLAQLLGADGLGALLDNSGSEEAAEALGDVLTNLVDAKADARLRLDPLLGLNLTLGLDLKALAGTKASLTDAEATTRIDELLAVNALATNTEAGANDLRIDWRNLDTGKTQSFQIDVNGLGAGDLPTLEELQAALQAQFDGNSDNTVEVKLETDADGNLRLAFVDPASTARDDTDRDALFADTSLAGAEYVALNDTYVPRALVLGNPADPADALDFEITLGDPAQTETLAIAAEAGRDLDGLVQALNEALNTLSIPVDSLDGDDAGTETAVLLQLFAFDLDAAGDLRLQTAPYVNKQGWGEFVLSVTETAQTGYLETSVSLDASDFVPLETYTPRSLNLDTLIKTDDGFAFAISVNGSDPIEIAVTEALSGATDEAVLEALNRALQDAQISRGDLSDTAVIGTTTSLSQVLRFEKIDAPEPGDSTFQLRTTNFAYLNGYDEIAVEILGKDISEEVEFTVTSIGDSNLARALGFENGVANDGDLTGGPLKIADITVTAPAPVAFVLTDDYVVANEAFDPGTATGDPLARVDGDGDTELRTISSSNISAELSLGVPDGLNIKLALGPAEAEIIGGEAFVGRSGGEDRGYIRGVVEDADGTDDGRYNIVDIYERAQSDDPKFLELFGLDVDFETRIDLPFSGAFGLLDPEKHGFALHSTLLRTNGGDEAGDENDNSVSADKLKATFDAAIAALPSTATAAEKAQAVSAALLTEHFAGDARQLGLAALDPDNAAGYLAALAEYDFVDFAEIDSVAFASRDALGDLPDGYFVAADAAYGPHAMALSLPGIGLFDCAGVLDLLNDPLAMLDGLEMIMSTIDGFLNDFMSDLDLPVVGDNLAVGASFFRDVRYDVLDPARAYLETPRADGSLPNTVDLVNDFLNAALNDLVNFRPVNLTDTAGDKALIAIDQLGDEEVFYGALSFGVEIFEAVLPIEFALDIPGIDLAVESATDMRLTSRLDIALGFGLDCAGGFFLLNSTDNGEEEVRLQFEAALVDGAGPEFAMSIGGALAVEAELETANEADANQSVSGAPLTRAIETADNRTGATVSLGLDLFGQSGTENAALDDGQGRSYDFAQSNFAGLLADAVDDKGTPGTADDVAFLSPDLFDRTVYISQINFSDFVEFTFNANVDAHIDLTARFDGPIGFVPALYTDFIFSAYVPEATFGPGGLDITKDLNITRLEFRDIHLDLGDLRNALGEVLNPIVDIISPVAEVFDTLGNAKPISYAIGALEAVFPIIRVADQINGLIGPGGLLDTSNPDGYSKGSDYLCIGTMDFLGVRGETPLTQYTIHQAVFLPCIDFQYNFDFNFAASFAGPGVFIEIPILQDPSQALNLLLGKFDQVDIVEVVFNLLEADIKADVAASILGTIGIPGWAANVIRGGFYADIEIYFKAALTMGYDLSGLINYANTLDPERLLDGIYIESQPGALIDGSIRASMGLNAGIASASGGINAIMNATFVDPNNDGKLRLPELLDRVDAAANAPNIGAALEEIFRGQFSVDFFLNFWAGINLPWPLPDLGWGFGISESLINYTFGASGTPITIEQDVGNTSYLNLGAAAGNNMSSMSQDGNDIVSFAGVLVNYQSNGQTFTGSRTLDASNRGVVTNLGEGQNVIDYTGLSIPATLTFAGAQTDTVTLPQTGTHVVFAGDGIDRIRGGGNGTYYIFAEGGADDIQVSAGTSGKVYVFTGDDYGMRELFQRTFNPDSTEQLTEGRITQLLTGAGGVLNGGFFTNGFTADSQLSEDRDDEVVLLTGSGLKQVYSGKGSDRITSSGGGTTQVFAGAGDDQIVISGGGVSTVEAGAGRDQITFTGGGSNTAFGWGAAAELNTAVARLDGDDILIGSGGVDSLYGQFGNDIIAGYGGDDALFGGLGNDLISGGILKLTPVNAAGEAQGPDVVLTDPAALKQLQTRLAVTTLSSADDGADSIEGGAGKDVLIGGSGSDTLKGGLDADLVIGDFGVVTVSSTRIAETFISSEITSGLGGLDILDGGVGGDILAAGGAGGADVTETITDLNGNNIVFGDFGIVQGARILESPTAFSAIPSLAAGGATYATRDNITTGAGNDIIFGGELADTINAGTGGDFIFGDLGSFVPADGTLTNDIYDPATGALLTNTLLTEGADVITLGTGGADDLFDLVIGGGGSDSVTSVNGGLVFIGDYGFVQLNPAGVEALLKLKDADISDASGKSETEKAAIAAELLKIERIVQSLKTVEIDDQGTSDPNDDTVTKVYGALSGATQRFGDDVLTTTAGGNVYAVLGGGADTANLAQGLSYVIGDDGTLGVAFVSVDAASQPLAADVGLITGRSISTQFAGNDTVTTAGGRDVILTGDGDDSVNAGDGLNIVMMDNGLLSASDDPYAFPTVLTSVAGAGDGNDAYTGGADEDLVVLGGGGAPGLDGFTDRASLGAGTNYAMGDSGRISVDLNSERDALGNPSDIQIIDMASDPLSVGSNDGADLITAADSEDFVILGLGADEARLGSGAAFGMGSSGTINVTKRGIDRLLDVSAASYAAVPGVYDGNDVFENGAGTEYLVLGLGEDRAELGDGETFVLGSEGTLRVTEDADGARSIRIESQIILPEQVLAVPPQTDGDDVVEAGVGDHFLVLGLGGDTANLGDGGMFIQASEGALSYVEDAAGNSALDITSRDPLLGAIDGDERITGASGEAYIVLGLGADVAELMGAAHVVGGEGGISLDRTVGGARDLVMDSQPLFATQQDGNDTVLTAAGDDFVILGLGDDLARLGEGANRVAGDQARIEFRSDWSETMLSLTPDLGGADEVETGSGADIVILGQGADQATTNGGQDIVLGDNGALAKDFAANDHLVRTLTGGFGAADLIDTGDQNDLILGGYGGDTILTGSGEDFALGDLGDVRFRNATDVEALSYPQPASGGDDVITATGTGDNILIGQAGSDTVTGATNDDLLIGDLAELTLQSILSVLPAQSTLDRMLLLEFTGQNLVFDDTLTGNEGADFLLGGYGGDSLSGGDGQDFLFGDTIRITRTYTPSSGLEFMLQETNFAFDPGGYDQMFGGDGPDILIGGLGPDLFAGNTQLDLIYGDSVAAEFEARFLPPLGFANDPTPLRLLTKVNFAGSNPVDLVSNAQTTASTGVFLSTNGFLSAFAQIGYSTLELTDTDTQPRGPSILDADQELQNALALVEDFFARQEVIAQFAEAIFVNMSRTEMIECMTQTFEESLKASGLPMGALDLALLQRLLEKVIDDNTVQLPTSCDAPTLN